MDRIVATSGTARAWGHGIVQLEVQIAALTTDPAFKAGDYGGAEPERGIQAYSLVWAGWLYSQEWWRRELWRGDTPPLTSLPQAIERYRHIFDGNDANDLILQARTWEAHDVGRTPGFGGNTIAALRSIRVPLLYMPSATDLYFPLEDARYECGFIRTCLLYPIPSLWGIQPAQEPPRRTPRISTTMSRASWQAHFARRITPPQCIRTTDALRKRNDPHSAVDAALRDFPKPVGRSCERFARSQGHG